MLQYKTQGGASPQGRPRVYFCSHPLDFTACFPFLSEELLEIQKNCAIWYDDAPETPHDEGSLSDLGQMQLFVIPVTFRLLTAPSRAMDVELPFAIDHHIPVLPIMQEQGLEALFAEKFGDLQFLDRFHTDPTAIPYTKKLEKFLSAVLVDDKMVAKIRAAFDAYVFLSYRKKDRKYAQKLMRLIHENNFCRDIAIWYDEFLSPGEDFNDAIREALEKSKLFLLAVTPNLVNETNYIMTTEYPLAKDAGKPILPAELVSTDKALLVEKYDGIPPCVNPYSKNGLSEALLSSLKTLALSENDSSPEHCFFIGLAYRDGVDVEVNHKKAVDLITSAADADLPEAINELVEMYRNGHGVKRSFETAVSWQKRLTAYREKCYTTSPSEQTLHELFLALCNGGDFLDELSQFSAAEQQYQRAYSFLTAFPESMTADTWHDLSICCECLGRVSISQDRPDTAKNFFEESLQYIEKIAAERGEASVRRERFICYDNLGDAFLMLGKFLSAQHYYQLGFDITTELTEESPSPEARHDLAVSLQKLGNIFLENRDYPNAKTFFAKALALQSEFYSEASTADAVLDYSISCCNMGKIFFCMAEYRDAEEFYEKAFAAAKSISEETALPAATHQLFICHRCLAALSMEQGKPSKARKHYKTALSIAQKLAKGSRYSPDLLVIYNELSDFYRRQNAPETARDYSLKAFSTSKELAEKTGLLKDKRALLVNYNTLGRALHTAGDNTGAADTFKEGLALASELALTFNTPESWGDLGTMYFNQAVIAPNRLIQQHALRQAYDIFLRLTKEYPHDPSYKIFLKNIQSHLL